MMSTLSIVVSLKPHPWIHSTGYITSITGTRSVGICADADIGVFVVDVVDIGVVF